MPTWGNTDGHNQKPKFDVEREVREQYVATVATGNTAGNNILTFTYWDGTATSNLSNVISIGNFVTTAPIGANGYPGFFGANNTVASISGNTVTFTNNFYGTVSSGASVEFDKPIVFNPNKTVETTYNQDTILVTATRASNVYATSNDAQANVGPGIYTANVGNFSQGWVHIQKKTNNDGTVRYLKETLVALANPVASNTASGNTSFGYFLTGL